MHTCRAESEAKNIRARYLVPILISSPALRLSFYLVKCLSPSLCLELFVSLCLFLVPLLLSPLS